MQVAVHAEARLLATRAMTAVMDALVGRPLYLVDFACWAVPPR